MGIKAEMCSDCYKTGHFRKDFPAGRHWFDYCKEDKENWEYYLSNAEETMDTGSEEDGNFLCWIKKLEQEKRHLILYSDKKKKVLISVIIQDEL